MKMKKAPTPLARLRPKLAAFVRHYDANGGNGVRAYLASHPECGSRKAAATGAYEALRKPEIQAALAHLQEGRWLRLQMSGDEALARVAMDARADPRELLDDDGNFLPMHHWPDDQAQSIKSFRATVGADDKPTVLTVTMNDSLAARRMILEQQGKLKNPLGAVGELARLLAGPNGDTDDDA